MRLRCVRFSVELFCMFWVFFLVFPVLPAAQQELSSCSLAFPQRCAAEDQQQPAHPSLPAAPQPCPSLVTNGAGAS